MTEDNSDTSIFNSIKQMGALLTPNEKFKWVIIVVLSLGVSVLEVATASFIVMFVGVMNDPESGAKYLAKIGIYKTLSPGQMLSYMAIACGAIYLVKSIVSAAENFFQNFTIQRMHYEFKNRMLHKFSSMDYGFYVTRNSSYGISVIDGDTSNVFTRGMTSVAVIVSEMFVLVFLLGLVVMMGPLLALSLAVVMGIIGLMVYKFLLPIFYSWGKKLQECSLLSMQQLMQFFHGFKEVVLFGKKDSFIGNYSKYARQMHVIQASQTATNNLPRMAIETLFVVFFMSVVVVMCAKDNNNQQMMSLLGGYLYVGFRVMPGLNRIISLANTVKSVVPSVTRMYKEYNWITSKDNIASIAAFEFKSSIELQGVSFKYLNTDVYVVDNINLKINKGDYVGIVGQTGSGKSTLVDLILGLLRPTSGKILIDGKYPVACRQWHKLVGYVPQSIYLTDSTIAENIAFGEKNSEIDSVRLQKAIESAQLKEMIARLPEGYNTVIGERGIRLSGGERQRIAIARALYREPEVLIFDEATSALDNTTESKLIATIDNISKNYTVIMIAHRVSTLKNCNKIVKVSSGQVEVGHEPNS